MTSEFERLYKYYVSGKRPEDWHKAGPNGSNPFFQQNGSGNGTMEKHFTIGLASEKDDKALTMSTQEMVSYLAQKASAAVCDKLMRMQSNGTRFRYKGRPITLVTGNKAVR